MIIGGSGFVGTKFISFVRQNFEIIDLKASKHFLRNLNLVMLETLKVCVKHSGNVVINQQPFIGMM